MDKLLAFVVAVLAALSSSLSAQHPWFTGHVDADFSVGSVFLTDHPDDVPLPPPAFGLSSGFDIDRVAFYYDAPSDTLRIGIRTFTIAGDADGDGDPANTSPWLVSLGGVDTAHFGGGECFALILDLNGDSMPDLIAGLPAGHDLSGQGPGFVVSEVASEGSIADPRTLFGTSLPAHNGGVFASPSAAAPHLEFAISGFSTLLLNAAPAGTTSLGVTVFLGSTVDGGIGDDGLPTGGGMSVLQGEIFPCFPMVNVFELADGPLPNGADWQIVTRYGLVQNYGCCALFSLEQQPGFVLQNLGGLPSIQVGNPANLETSILVVDLGAPLTTAAITCKETLWDVPGFLPSLMQIHMQIFAYPNVGTFDPALTYYASNVITYEQP